MKRLALFVGVFFATQLVFGQDTYVTNKEGSEYQLTKIKHLAATPVESQGYAGTCWSFSALSFFESELNRKGKGLKNVLSEMYIVYHAYLGKAEKYVRMNGHSNFDEGGAFHDIPWVIQRYGIVPQSAFKGLNYGMNKHSHAELAAVLKGAMDGLMNRVKGLKDNDKLTTAWKPAIRGILGAYLGGIPKETRDFTFTVEGKQYDPISYRDQLDLNMEDYISLTSFTNHPFYEKCQLAIPDNWSWGMSYNVPLEDLWKAARHALSTDYSFAWGADVSEDYFSFRSGLAIVPKDKSTLFVSGENEKNYSSAGSEKKSSCFMNPVEEEAISSEKRQGAYENKQTTDDHGMHVVGLYKDQNDTEYFLVKNSWGTGHNDCDGYFYASRAYFEYKTINIYLHKEALPKYLRKKLKI